MTRRYYDTAMWALLAVLLFTACKEEPVPLANLESQWTPKRLQEAADRLHKVGAPSFYAEGAVSGVPVAAVGGYLAGFFDHEAKDQFLLCHALQQLDLQQPAVQQYAQQVWSGAGQAIGEADQLLLQLTQVQGMPEPQRNRYAAEARFLRAFNRFYLLRAFGKAPGQEGDLRQAYGDVLSDLQQAIPALPDSTLSQTGFRPGRAAAQMLLADVYLTMSGYPLRQAHYRQAADMARQVIGGGKYALEAHGATDEVSAYNTLRTRNECQEYLYTYRGGGKGLSALCLSKDARQWGMLKAVTQHAYQPTAQLIGFYDRADDLRVQERQFFHSFFPYEKEGKVIVRTYSPSPYFWFDREALLQTGVSRKDAIIYRYAEVLLLAAESIAMSEGVTPEAVRYLADVRCRAYTRQDRTRIVEQLSALGTEAFVEQVWLERLREFPLEMKAWTDLQRTRSYPQGQGKARVYFVPLLGARTVWGSAFGEQHLLLPLPASR